VNQNIRNPRILVRGVNWLGDAVMSTPALLRLRESRPDAHITLLTQEKLADLWQGHPALNAALTFAARESLWSVARRLREGNFQTALALPNSLRCALELWLARIPQRIGFSSPGRNWFFTQRVPARAGFVKMRKRSIAEINRLTAPDSSDASTAARRAQPPDAAHHLHHYLHLAAALGANPEPLPPFLAVTREEVEAVQRKFSLGADAPWFGLNPGAEYGPAKRWLPDRFLAAAIETQKQSNCRWLILGGPADAALATGLAQGLSGAFPSAPPMNLAGKTTLRELCALLKRCRVLLTNDTGPMHVAAAVGTPVVALFGSTSPQLTGPGLPGEPRHRLLHSTAACSPCFRRECPIDFRCMTAISVERVVTTILENFPLGEPKPK